MDVGIASDIKAIRISRGSMISILKEHLGMRKPSVDGCQVCSQSTTNAVK